MRLAVALGLVLLCTAPFAAGAAEYARLPGASFRSVLRYEDIPDAAVRIRPFALMRTPVTNAEFLAFVRQHPEWRRDRVPTVMAESRYLAHWSGPLTLGAQALPQQPVTQVSWFAADAYCRAQGARLPATRNAALSTQEKPTSFVMKIIPPG